MDFSALKKKYDPEHLCNMLHGYPDQMAKAYECVTANPLSEKIAQKNFKRIILCGMGGSSWYTDVINDLYSYLPPITVNRDYVLPSWVDKDVLVIISSYSGNTEESLANLEQALEREVQIVVVTAGGQLLEKAKNLKLPLLQVPDRTIQPRMANGYTLFFLSYILVHFGFLKGEVIADFLRAGEFLKKCEYETLAQDIAEKIGERVPIIYATTPFRSTGLAWKICMNENAKIPSFWNFFPELNHNEMNGFVNLRMETAIIYLQSPLDHPKNTKRMQIVEMLLQDSLRFIHVPLQGNDQLEQTFYGLLLGYWVSYYVALANKIDPTPVEMVEKFKAKMK